MKMTVVCDVELCSLLEVCRRFRLYGAISQKTFIDKYCIYAVKQNKI
jgi:hypothetical protein